LSKDTHRSTSPNNTTILPGDGVYVAAGFTLSAAANLARDLNFNDTISGNVWYNCTATKRLTLQSCKFNCRYSERHQSYCESYQNLKNMLTRFRRLT
jgi:hypothetical protein